jgi:hypothetical protein
MGGFRAVLGIVGLVLIIQALRAIVAWVQAFGHAVASAVETGVAAVVPVLGVAGALAASVWLTRALVPLLRRRADRAPDPPPGRAPDDADALIDQANFTFDVDGPPPFLIPSSPVVTLVPVERATGNDRDSRGTVPGRPFPTTTRHRAVAGPAWRRSAGDGTPRPHRPRPAVRKPRPLPADPVDGTPRPAPLRARLVVLAPRHAAMPHAWTVARRYRTVYLRDARNVVVGRRNRVRYRTTYRVNRVRVTTDRAFTGLSARAQAALSALIRDPADNAANRAFRDCLRVTSSKPPAHAGSARYDIRTGGALDIVLKGTCRNAVSGVSNRLAVRETYVQQEGDVPLTALLQRDAELVRRLARSLRAGRLDGFARRVRQTCRAMGVDEVIERFRFDDGPAPRWRRSRKSLHISAPTVAAVGGTTTVDEKHVAPMRDALVTFEPGDAWLRLPPTPLAPRAGETPVRAQPRPRAGERAQNTRGEISGPGISR